ncbi:MAG: nitroreductase family deazaflavin-dependent oxidoreductase [Chloroflexi bacterium]|nr:nitroreductase family deazaflavin-dependent oxidoreductase [Chloroflexota bacterium]
MPEDTEPQFLYLTTTGRTSGQPHQIEIWFVAYDDAYYLCSEARDQTDWMRNIRAYRYVQVRIGSPEAPSFDAVGRAIDPAAEPERAAAVAALFEAKYDWNDGLLVELRPF